MEMTDTVYYVLLALAAAYEVLLRVIPTEGNWTILHNAMRVVDWLVKNRSTENKEFTVARVETPTEEVQ